MIVILIPWNRKINWRLRIPYMGPNPIGPIPPLLDNHPDNHPLAGQKHIKLPALTSVGILGNDYYWIDGKGSIVIDYPVSCMGPPHPPVYKQTTLAAPCVCLMTTPNQIAVAQAVQSLPALHRLSTQLIISVATLPQDPYISFKYFDKYSHNATKLVIC